MSLFPSDPVELRRILARPSPPPRSVAERLEDERRVEQVIKVAVHTRQQETRVAELRSELDAMMGARLEQEWSARLSKTVLSEAAQRQYSQDFRRFKTWCTGVGVSALPAASESLATFLLETCAGADDEKPKPAMAARMCTAIRLRHLLASQPDPTDSLYVRAVRRWIKESIPQLPEPVKVETPDQQH